MTGYQYAIKRNFHPYLEAFTKINSKEIINLNAERKIIKLLGKNIERKSLWP
jgi:hypothetical protein